MPSFNEIRKMSVTDIRNAVRSRGKKVGDGKTDTNEKNRLAIANAPYVPTLPGVNILPASTLQRRRTRQTIRKFAIIGIAIAVIFVACGVGAFALDLIHKQTLAQIQATNAGIQTQVNALNPYATYKSGIENARKSAGTTLSNDVDVAQILSDLNSVAGNYGVTYTSISMTLSTGGSTAGSAGSGGGGCFNPDPFNPSSSIGCLTLSGTANSQSRATGFFNKFKGIKGFLNGFISSLTQSDTGKATFNGTLAFDQNFYSKKYTTYATPLDALLQQQKGGVRSNQVDTLTATLKSSYKTVFANASSATISNLAAQVCAAANAGGATAATLSSVISQNVGTRVSTNDSAGIAGTIINTSCASALSKVNLSKVNLSNAGTPTATSTVTPLPNPTVSAPSATSTQTAGTNG